VLKMALRLEDAPHCAPHAAPCVLAKSAHAFAKLFAAANRAAMPYVLAEAFSSTPCGFSGAAEGAAYAMSSLSWPVAARAPVSSALRHVEHAPVLVILILRRMSARR
jgi:hypothetical protein